MDSADNLDPSADRGSEVPDLATALFGAVVENSRSGIVLETGDRAVLLVNSRYCSIFGLDQPPQRFHGRDGRVLESVTRDALANPAGFVARNREITRAGKVVVGEELSLQDGRVVQRNYRPVVAPDGKGVGHVWEYHDVTDSRRIEATLRTTQDELRQAQKLEAVGRLAASVAHDFNNLLMVIIGYSESVLANLDDKTVLRRGANQIWKTADRASALTRHLLAFSRKQNLQPQILDPNALIRELQRVLRCLVREDIAIVHVLQAGVATVEADPGQLETMLVNLVVNACDAMPQGGKIFIETSDIELDAGYVEAHPGARPGPHVRISVTDTGSGMDEETRQHIFEPFFTTKQDKGTGLGLSTVYGIVKQSGGNIWVYTELGLGSSFKIYLPRAVRSDAPALEPMVQAEDDARKPTLLLVEDEDAIRELLRDELGRAGFAVLAAARPREALRICEEREERIDLLITDVVMPQMSGRVLARRVAQLHDEARVLYMSGYTAEALIHNGSLVEDVNFLEKPVSPQSVVRAVREILAGNRPRGRTSVGRPGPSPDAP